MAIGLFLTGKPVSSVKLTSAMHVHRLTFFAKTNPSIFNLFFDIRFIYLYNNENIGKSLPEAERGREYGRAEKGGRCHFTWKSV